MAKPLVENKIRRWFFLRPAMSCRALSPAGGTPEQLCCPAGAATCGSLSSLCCLAFTACKMPTWSPSAHLRSVGSSFLPLDLGAAMRSFDLGLCTLGMLFTQTDAYMLLFQKKWKYCSVVSDISRRTSEEIGAHLAMPYFSSFCSYREGNDWKEEKIWPPSVIH